MKDLVPAASTQATPPANGIYNALQLDAASTASGPSQAYSQLSRADGNEYSALGPGQRPVSMVSSTSPEYNALSDNRRSVAGASNYSALASHASAGRPASASLSSSGPEYSALNREGVGAGEGGGHDLYNALAPGGGGGQRPVSTISSATPEYNVLDAKSRPQAASTSGASLYSALDSEYVMPPFMGGTQSATAEYSLLNSDGRQATSAGAATASEYSALDSNTQTSFRGQTDGATPAQPEYNVLQRATSTDAATPGYKRTLRREEPDRAHRGQPAEDAQPDQGGYENPAEFASGATRAAASLVGAGYEEPAGFGRA